MNQIGKRKARILVVDDDPGLLRLLTIRLRAESYDVEAVESAAQAAIAQCQAPSGGVPVWLQGPGGGQLIPPGTPSGGSATFGGSVSYP